MERANKDIKEALQKYNVRQWELADKIGYSHNYFCLKLRHELTSEEKLKMFDFIEQIAKEREE